MRTDIVALIDVADLPRLTSDHRHPLWWGILGLIGIELTVVSAFAVSALYVMVLSPPWPPAGVSLPPLLWESVNVGLLLASAAAMWWAGRGISRGDNRVLIIGLGLALLLDTLVLVFRWIQLQSLDFGWNEHAFGSFVWTLSGFHFAHVASAIVGTAVVEVLAVRGFWTRERQLAVVVDTLYWYFVSFAWIPLYLAIYWAPRVFP